MEREIILERKDNIGIIILNRPKAKNSFSESMLTEWLKILRELKDDPKIKGVILTANGKVFCSGGDIQDMLDGKMSGWDMKNFLSNYVHKIGIEMETFYKPIIAAINGPAIGAGLDMALMCDFRVASENAIFSEAYIKLGLVAGDGGAFFLPKIVGLPRALEMLLTGKIISPEKALEWGLVNKVVKHDYLLEESIKFLNEIIQWPLEALKLMKKTIYSSQNQSLKDYFAEVSSHMGMLTSNREFIESVEKLSKALSKKG